MVRVSGGPRVRVSGGVGGRGYGSAARRAAAAAAAAHAPGVVFVMVWGSLSFTFTPHPPHPPHPLAALARFAALARSLPSPACLASFLQCVVDRPAPIDRDVPRLLPR